MVDSSNAAVEAADEEETRSFLLSRAKRGFAVVPKIFVQQPAETPYDPKQPRGAILSTFVTRGDLRGLQSYLFLSAIISNGDGDNGWSTTLPLAVWARVFGTTTTAGPKSASSSASKILTRLEERKLIERHRKGRERKVTVTLLHPDGSGAPYVREDVDGDMLPYLKLNNAFWTEGWYEKLDLPATAMLLVALQEKPSGFKLPSERMPLWYGWSSDTAERGLKTLVDEGLINKSFVLEKAPLSPTGLTKTNFYKVQPPFGAAQTKTKRLSSLKPLGGKGQGPAPTGSNTTATSEDAR
ncbi:hypothetical protein B2J88_50580 [Rhodococcus sp. SRB_17]|nr:hypothetical protein [Rhodococcus sp. SRB_17]